MNKIKKFFVHMVGGFGRWFSYINIMHKEFGVGRVFLFFDTLWVRFRYDTRFLHYRVFGFPVVRGKVRKTYLTLEENFVINDKLNDSEHMDILQQKPIFLQRYKEYVKRGFIDLRECNAEEFAQFCEGKDSIFVKSLNDYGGHGVGEEPITADTDLGELYNKLLERKQYLIEEKIVQHEKLNELCPTSVNTIRIVTVNYKGKVHFINALMRIGDGKSCVDNICRGGMYVGIRPDGSVTTDAFCDEICVYFQQHPVTGVKFEGFTVPFYKEAEELCMKAAEVEPNLGYVGWDVAITPTGPVLVEGNAYPGFDMCQNYRHIGEDKHGIKPEFVRILGEDFFKTK
ncbi:MAG: hypothetical protein J1E39_10095 [Eubacterium sp.]|nr:hypothetical protein [Eubacterium sp.]